VNRVPLKENREAHDLDHDHLHQDHDYGGDHPQIEHQGAACCAHEHSETGTRNRLLFVFAGAICLILSGVWRWLRPDQAELFELWAMIGAVITAIPILRDALVGLISRGTENTEVCMTQFITIAVIACFVTGHYVTGALVAIILLVGHILEDRSMLGTNAAIRSLLKLSRVRARRVRNGQEELVDAETLQETEIVRARPGDTIPVDGRVVGGYSTVNQATITGEALPIEVASGAPVFAGTLNLTGLIEIEVMKTGANTVLSRVKKIVEEAQQTRAPIIRLTEEYARYYTPLILMIAALVLFFTRDAQRAISVIVVSIPCAFVLAGPSAMLAALASASRMGILIKSVRFFEAACEVDTLVFDKTGTLTTGELQVAEIFSHNGMSENEILALAGAIERHSTHPIARAIASAAQERGLELDEASEVQETHGHGLSGKIAERDVLVGRASWLRAQQVHSSEDCEALGELSALHVAVDGKLAGAIYLRDAVRVEARAIFEMLRQQGVNRCIMLTGDRRCVAEKIAVDLGFAEFAAECLPEQKLKVVHELKAAGRNVMVIGDGVNDAPALAASNLSIAMGALGSDVAIQTADIALMATDLRRIPQFLELANRALRIVNQNLLYGLLFMIVAVLLSSMGVITPIVAGFVHEFSTFFVIFNSARLLRFEGKN